MQKDWNKEEILSGEEEESCPYAFYKQRKITSTSLTVKGLELDLDNWPIFHHKAMVIRTRAKGDRGTHYLLWGI